MVVVLAGCAAPGPAGPAATGPTVPSVTPGSITLTTTAGTSAAGSTAPPLVECGNGALPTVVPGTITIGTESPAAAPWFVAGTPSNGEGLESAVGYAVAAVLGYGRDQVSWRTVDRLQAAAGATTGSDLVLNQFTAPDMPASGVDYSTGYFSVTDTLVTSRSAPLPTASVAALAGQRVGAVAGAAGAGTAMRVTGSSPTTFADQRLALAALAAGAVPAVVLSTPDALTAAAADPGLQLVGQLPIDPSVQPTQFKALLPKGSALTGCVSGAIDRLRVEGTLEQLATQWVDPAVPQLR